MQQVVARTAFLGFLFLATACASTTQAVQPQAPPRGGVLDFRLDSYDGDVVRGRLLIGATIDPLTIDSRHAGWFRLGVDHVRRCDKAEPLVYTTTGCFAVWPPRPDEIITLKPGTWFGETVIFSMLDRSWSDQSLDCFETKLSARSADGQTIATIPIRVERTDKKAAPKAEGAKEPNEPNAPRESTPDAPSPKAP